MIPFQAVKSLWDRKGRTKASTMKWATRGRWEVGASRLWGQGEGFHCRLLAQALTGAQAQCTPPPDLSSPSLPISPCPSLLRPLRTSTLLSFSQKPPSSCPPASLPLSPPPSGDLPLPSSQVPPLAAAGSPSPGMTVKSFPRAVWE